MNSTLKLSLIIVVAGFSGSGFGVTGLDTSLSDSSRGDRAQTDLSSREGLARTASARTASANVDRRTELPAVVPQEKPQSGDPDLIKDLIKRDPELKVKWDISKTETVKAWRQHKVFGNRLTIACIVDTGCDVNHPNLKAQMNINEGEACKNDRGVAVVCDKSTNGVDDDGNGYVDDVYGYDFALNTGKVTDSHGHGTHIAGIVAGSDGYGIAPGVQLICAKYYDPKAAGNNNLMNTERAIRYCTQRGADIINYSGGGLEPSALERAAIADAKKPNGQPILFIAAAGNERSNSDFKKYYPASYGLPNIISVTATDSDTNVLPSSNYGTTSVDIAAPGKNIFSTLPGARFGQMTGTSQATAVVTGAAALLKQKFPDYTASEVISALTESGEFRPDKLEGKTKLAKTLNIYRALSIYGDGVGVSGVKATNTTNLSAKDFAISSGATGRNPIVLDVAELSRALKAAEKDQFKKKSAPRLTATP
jgi:thermitase